MGGKVIKFNLMGAIGILIIIIAVIVGIITFTTRGKSNKDNKEENDKKEVVEQDKESYNELDRKELVTIKGLNKEISLRTYERNSEFKIEYDVDSFYVDDRDQNKLYFESLISDSILIEIQRNAGFKNKSNELISYERERKEENDTYKLENKNFNGHSCYIETKEDDRDVMKNYYIESGNEYYYIRVLCGKEYKDTMMPIIEKMIETFKIM